MSNFPDQPIQKYMKMHSANDLSDYWFDAYGWIACYFAQLEGLSYALIDSLGTEEDKAAAARSPYQARTDRAKNILCEHLRARGDAELADEWSEFLADAKATAPMRNKILHNPLSVNLALGNPLQDQEAGIILPHESGRSVLKLGAVQAFSKSMLDLNIRMQGLLTRSALVPDTTDPT